MIRELVGYFLCEFKSNVDTNSTFRMQQGKDWRITTKNTKFYFGFLRVFGDIWVDAGGDEDIRTYIEQLFNDSRGRTLPGNQCDVLAYARAYKLCRRLELQKRYGGLLRQVK